MSVEEKRIRAIVREEVSRRIARTPKIIKKTMTEADTEYKMALPAGTKKFTMHMRETNIALRFAYEKGRVADPKEPYFTLAVGTPYWEDNLDLPQHFIIYVACATAAKTVEVIAWR